MSIISGSYSFLTAISLIVRGLAGMATVVGGSFFSSSKAYSFYFLFPRMDSGSLRSSKRDFAEDKTDFSSNLAS